MDNINIKEVAIYLRKSRGDFDEDLKKHKKALLDLCKKNEWDYDEYQEIGSGGDIASRPQFQKLIEKIAEGKYDAVCVMDIDRLCRGDEVDYAFIKRVIIQSDTKIVTPDRILDLNNDTDEFTYSASAFFANLEYKMIKKRLMKGKRMGARMGNWTNGIPPYPYEYQKWEGKYFEKKLVVNDDKLIHYRFIIDSIINESMTPDEIAYNLNERGIPSPRNASWSGVTISRLMTDETHLGRIITNKTIGDAHAKKKQDAKDFKVIPRDEWIVVENCHEPVKSIEEHNRILVFKSRLNRVPKRKPAEIRPLSGLIKCGRCGHSMTLYYRPSRKNPESIKPCWYKDSLGNKCINQGMITNTLYDLINQRIFSYKEQLVSEIESLDFLSIKYKVEKELKNLTKEKERKLQTLDRILLGFENELYTLQQSQNRKQCVEKELSEINAEIELLEIEMEKCNADKIKDKYELFKKFEKQIISSKLSDEQKNKLYKSIIDKIIWIREDNNINIRIEFK